MKPLMALGAIVHKVGRRAWASTYLLIEANRVEQIKDRKRGALCAAAGSFGR